MAGGDIFLTGRAKDLIIRAGRNLYPHELEEAVGNIAGIRKGCVSVFGSQDRATGTERLVVMAETRETMPEKLDSLRNEINAAAITLIGIPPDDIVLAPIHTVLKTSSGKIRRAASRERYERGMQIPRAAWRQVLSLVWAGMLPQLRHTFRAATDFLYAGYAWGLFWLIAPLTWLMAIALPRPSWSWSISHMGARLFVWLSGVPFTVSGSENLPDENIACIVVSNHASYLDGIILVAALPRQFSFVAKIELKDSFISRLYLEHIGSEFVARYEPRRSVEDIKLLGKSIDASRSLIFFPEGTFSRMPGLMPFHMGAFAIAVNAGVPIVPVTVRGTRSVLRNGHWFPRRGEIGVKISPPIMPDGTDWAAAIRLRDATRAEILSHCGEPGLSI